VALADPARMSAPANAAYLFLTAPVLALALAVPTEQVAPRSSGATFTVATWNIRSGMGVRRSAARWDHTTLNCTDPEKPVNAWGIGLPQRELEALRADTRVVAVALQESWNCGKPRNVNAVLGFKTITREQQGVALAARYGFDGDPAYHRIDPVSDRWIIGGRVCLDAACNRAIPMFSTHWGGKTDEDYALQARVALEFLARQPVPHLFMGDLNVFQIDRWNPKVACTSDDRPGRSRALALIAAAGYIDAWKATQNGAGWTGMASRPGCGRPGGGMYKRIDYVHVRGLQVVRTAKFAEPAPGGDSPSDHAGVMAELEVPAPGEQ
jgi:endonuclease/exonuclease/phosphatase family metal-dependent hydrolase